MKLLNIVIEKDKAHDVLKDIVLAEKIHLVSAISEINENNFVMKVDAEHIEEVAGLCLIDTFTEKKDYKSIQKKLYKLMEYMQIPKTLDKQLIDTSFDFIDLQNEIDSIYEDLSSIRLRMQELSDEKSQLSQMSIIQGIYEPGVDFRKLFDLEYFNIKFGILTKDNMERLIRNYENIYAAVLHIGRRGHDEIYVVISLKELAVETERILRSVYFEDISLLDEYLGTPEEMIKKIDERMLHIDQELEGLQLRSEEYDEQYGKRLMVCYAHLMLEIKIEQMKKYLAVTSNYVYISGWVGEEDEDFINTLFEPYGDQMVIGESDDAETVVALKPPTKLNNNWLFKPFENLVHMYGTPSYSELDPTPFVALAYMILFGAMFGDLGQGMLLVLAGVLMTRKRSSDYGGILKRIGLFSMVFGFFYDSFFGYEHVISKLFPESLSEKMFLRPIEHINTVLILAVVTGLIFLLISYGYSIVNKIKSSDLKEGVFGRNGVVGLCLYLVLLLWVGGSALGWRWVPVNLLKILAVIAVVLMVIREPLSNSILKKRPLYHEPASAYYVESGFELLETFLGMLSNSVSFIRVGAFALNHVGLFMAFHTIASLIGTASGEVVMFVIGNAVVIGLEGLIVLIQGLRLVYYEMFSKYYNGEGEIFSPAVVDDLGGNK